MFETIMKSSLNNLILIKLFGFLKNMVKISIKLLFLQ